jgi:F-type H+-transporting ATPase subunit b
MRRSLGSFIAAGMLAALPAIASAAPHPALAAPTLFLQAVPGEHGGHGQLLDLINLIILIAVLIYVLRKPIGRFFSQRSEDIRKSVEEGRKALAAAQKQLASAEERLHRLEQDIAALKDSAAREMEAERERLRKAAEEETERILESARSIIHSATQTAKLELKHFAARQAIQLAEKMIQERFNDQDQSRLVNRFLQGIPSRQDGKRSAD